MSIELPSGWSLKPNGTTAVFETADSRLRITVEVQPQGYLDVDIKDDDAWATSCGTPTTAGIPFAVIRALMPAE